MQLAMRSLPEAFALAVQARADFDAMRDADRFHRAAEAWRELVEFPAVAADPVARGEVLASLGVIYLTGADYEQDALDTAIRYLTMSLEASDIPVVALELGVALAERYQQRGEPADLDAAIDRLSLAAAGTSAQDQDHYLGMLGLMFTERFTRSGNVTDLTAAVRSFSAAERAAPAGSARKVKHMVNLGVALQQRGSRMADAADLRRSAEVLRNARTLTQSGSEQDVRILAALGAAHGMLGRQTSSRFDLDAAVETTEAALRAAREPAKRSELLANLAAALSDRYYVTRDTADLDRSIELYDQSLKAAFPGTKPHAMRMHGLAMRLADRAEAHSDPAESLADWRRAREYFRASYASAGAGPAELLLSFSQDWLVTSARRGDWTAAAEAAVVAAEEMRLAFAAQGSQEYQRQEVRLIANMATLAAFSLASADRIEEALTVLDQGRARLLTASLDRDWADMDHLAEQGQAALAEEYRRLAAETVTEQEIAPHLNLAAATSRSTRQQQLRLDRGRLVDRIRQVPGYERFHAPASYPGIAAVAEPAPLVYLVSTRFGGLALVVRSPGRPPLKVALPGLSAAAVAQRLGSYDEAYRNRLERPREWSRAVDSITRWAHDEVLGPVLERLTGSRLILIPCGALVLLPLHAAWQPDPGRPGGRQYVLDDMTIGYAASARTLSEARRLAGRSRADGVLVVEDPGSARMPSLPAAAYESAAVLASFPVDRRRHLRGEDATLQAVTSALDSAPVWHFACHAMTRTELPLSSGILLAHDDWFTIERILKLRRAGVSARLAVLSACATGVVGLEAPDEVVSLPTAMLQAGVAGAVASLWPVGDRLAALLTAEFYRRWVGHEPGAAKADPALALREAQIWLRDASASELHRHHPELVPAPPPVSSAASRLMATAPAPYADPVNWAAFTFWGA